MPGRIRSGEGAGAGVSGARVAGDSASGKKVPGVDAIERAIAIVDVLASAGEGLPLAAVARRTGLYPSTILRIAASLDRHGYIRRDSDGCFRPGPTLWRLGQAYQATYSLAGVIRPALADLAMETGETAAFYVREGDRRICLYRVNGPMPVRSHLDEGDATPLDRGAGAHVLMAFSESDPRHEPVRAERLSVSLGERSPESAAAAVPVFDGSRFIGALGVAGPITRFTPARIDQFVAALRRACAEIEAAIARG